MVIFPLKEDKSPAVPKGQDWRTYKGQVSTPMLGISIPQGLFIIDLDLYKGITTDDVDFALGVNLDWEAAELQKTMKGGKHYVFRVNCEMPNGTDLLDLVGFDTRAAGKGYIATGEGYENLTFCDSTIEAIEDLDQWPELPGEAIEVLKARDQILEDDEGLLEAVSSQTLDLTPDEIEAYIDALPDCCADDQEQWLRVGMALYHQMGGDGWELFDKFSQRCAEKYDRRKNKARWDSFAKNRRANPVTFATVIELAGGRSAIAEYHVKSVDSNLAEVETLDDIKGELQKLANMKLDSLSLDVALKKVQNKYQEIMGDKPSIGAIKKELKKLKGDKNSGDYVDDYVFLTATAEYFNKDTKAVCGPRAFDVKHNRETPVNGEGEKQSASTYANDIIECVENSMYFPAAAEIFTHNGLDYINTYRSPNIKPVKVGTTDIVERIKNHIAHLVSDEQEQRIILDYLAFNVQRPGQKLNWSIVLQGVQGDGKSLLAEMMQHVMGYDNVRIMNVQSLESQFTGWATGQCMTFIEELKLDNMRKYEVLNNLKPYISNPVIEEHKKGKDPRTVINTTNYFALTNFKDAIPIDENDRRYCIIFSRWQRVSDLQNFMAKNKDYYPKLYEAMRENYAEIRTWLLSHKISDEFLTSKRAPHTKAKELMTELSKSPMQVCLEEALEHFDEQINLPDGEIDVTWLGKLISNESDFDDRWDEYPKTNTLKNCLLNLGYEAVGRKKTKYSGENKHYVYRK